MRSHRPTRAILQTLRFFVSTGKVISQVLWVLVNFCIVRLRFFGDQDLDWGVMIEGRRELTRLQGETSVEKWCRQNLPGPNLELESKGRCLVSRYLGT